MHLHPLLPIKHSPPFITLLLKFLKNNPTLISKGKCDENILLSYFDPQTFPPHHKSILNAIKCTNIPKLLSQLNFPNNTLTIQLYKFTQTPNPTPKQFKQIISESIIQQFSDIELFGSIIYNTNNANDIDIYGTPSDFENIINFLRIFFDVTTIVPSPRVVQPAGAGGVPQRHL